MSKLKGKLGRILGISTRQRDDKGQALLIVLIVVFLLAALAPALAATVNNELPQLDFTNATHAAFAAIEAGEQDYRNYLNGNPTYYLYGTSLPADPNNPAMGVGNWAPVLVGTGCNSAGVPASGGTDGCLTSPPEYFHYTPNTNFLGSANGNWSEHEILLTITGRAGFPHHWAYETAVIAYRKYASYLQNAYYSTLEVLDPKYPEPSIADPTVTVVTTPSGGTATTTTPQETDVPITYTDPETGLTVNTNLWNAMCQYDGYQENSFIDSLNGTAYAIANNFVSGQSYSATYPFYGPFFGYPKGTLSGGTTAPSTDSTAWTAPTTANPFTYQYTSGTTTIKITLTSDACQAPYDFNSGETFTGPVFSQDELHVCDNGGKPDFTGVPYSILTGTPTSAAFKYEWPGSIKASSGPLKGDWVPYGTNLDPINCGSSGSVPTMSGSLVLGANELLPQFDNSLIDYADGSNPDTVYGCLFTGPTMIELVDTGGTETMNVWSPLSKQTDYSASGKNCGNGKFSPTSAWVKGIAMPADGVIYDQDVPGNSSDPNYWSQSALDALDTSTSVAPAAVTAAGSTCWLNPEQSTTGPDSTACTDGNLFVEGELTGPLTIAADQNIYITRDITYACGDTGGALQSPVTPLPAACSSATDLLGLYANTDILFTRPVTSGGADVGYCSNNGVTGITNTVADVLPTCDVDNPIVDALLIALQGSFGIQNWDKGSADGDMNLNGSDVSSYRGPFGYSGTSGYFKNFAYDTRLAYLVPPDAISATVTNWYPFGWVDCGGVDTENSTSPACAGPG